MWGIVLTLIVIAGIVTGLAIVWYDAMQAGDE